MTTININECLENSNDDSGIFNESNENCLMLQTEEEHRSMKELNNRFARFIEHIRQQDFRTQSNEALESVIQIPSIQLENLKSLYESEIKSLREALDKQSNNLAAATVNYDKLLAEKDNMGRDLRDKEHQISLLIESIQKSESENAFLKIQIEDLKRNQHLASELSSQLKTCQAQLETEVLLRTASENACLTYKEKMEFNESVFKKELGALMMTNKSILSSMTSLDKDFMNSNLFQQMENARNKLQDNLKDFRNLIDKNLLETIDKAAKALGNQVKTRSNLKRTNDELLRVQHNLVTELSQIKASHCKLEDQLSDLQTLNDNEIYRLRQIISELSQNKIDELDSLLKDLNKSMNHVVSIQSEICVYRTMLDSEQDRTLDYTLNSPQAKRRKLSPETNGSGSTRKIIKASRHNKICSIM